MQHGALDHTLEGGGRVHLSAVLDDEGSAVVVKIIGEIAPQLLDVELTSGHNLSRILILRKREEKVFERCVLVLALACELQGAFEGAFKAGSQGWHLFALVLAFHSALKGMFVPSRKVEHLRYFRLGYVVGIDPADTHPVIVDVKHDPSRLFPRLVEEMLQNENDKLHGGVVIVEQQHPI
jgi:hypothetical protein